MTVHSSVQKHAAALYAQAADFNKTARFYYMKAQDAYYLANAQVSNFIRELNVPGMTLFLLVLRISCVFAGFVRRLASVSSSVGLLLPQEVNPCGKLRGLGLGWRPILIKISRLKSAVKSLRCRQL
jgi:hypothetical protein